MSKKLLLIVFATILLLVSCSQGGARIDMLNKDKDKEKTDARLEQIIEAMNNRDREALRAVFSKQALADAENLDDNMDYLFDFLSDEINSWEMAAGPAVTETIDHGHNKKVSQAVYYINTEKQEYQLYFLEYTVDTDHPENVGMFMLEVFKAGDRSGPVDWGSGTRSAGIYRPDEHDLPSSE